MPPFDPDRARDYPAVIGVDEVGRGALCGPVVVAAVWFDPVAIPASLLGALDDSKRLAAARRDQLADALLQVARVRIAATSAARIDRRGIRTMTLDAMRRAAHGLAIDALVLVDGIDRPPGLDLTCETRVKGDATVPQIAAASIVAKSCRDRLLVRLARRHPGYAWERNAGYGTAEHLAALATLGPTRHHRQSFAPVSQAALAL
ncbi:MAG: ribonuclease HII [Gemmatimonadaceae bacterium]|jgi:ribonuclease HII|nr:ribonuclease HII [Gemmatimonadaceae bacterium]